MIVDIDESLNNLERFQKMVRKLSTEERDKARNYFIGILSVYIETEKWNKALKSLQEMLEEDKRREQNED